MYLFFGLGVCNCIGVGACLDGDLPRWARYGATPGPYSSPRAGGRTTDGPGRSSGWSTSNRAPSSETLASAGEQVLGTFYST